MAVKYDLKNIQNFGSSKVLQCLLSERHLCILTLKSHGCVRLCDQGTHHPGKGDCLVRGAPLKGPGDRSSREAVRRVPGGGSSPDT